MANPADLTKYASEAVRRRNPELFAQPKPHDVPGAIKRQRGRPEGEFQDAVSAYAESRGWLCYHTFDSRRSVSGFPDLVMLRGHRQVVAELKHGDNRVTPEQDVWLRAFVDAGAQVYEWRDRDWPEIERVLR